MRQLFYAGRISPRFPRSTLVYGGVDPFQGVVVTPFYADLAAAFWGDLERVACDCEEPCEENNWTAYTCAFHHTHDPRGD